MREEMGNRGELRRQEDRAAAGTPHPVEVLGLVEVP